ncbi:MAG: hypothetical protein ACJ72H_30630 [Candidatus Sulfotelmatobacter sp.]
MTRLDAQCGYNRGLVFVLVLIGLAAVMVGFKSPAWFGAFAAVAGLIMAFAFNWNARAEKGEDNEASYLIRRLDQALTSLAKDKSPPIVAI